MLKALEIFFAQEKTKPIFDHLRNLLVCTLLLAAGSFQLKQPFGIFADSVFQSLLGYGVVAMAVILILLHRTILGSGDLFTAADCVRMLEETGVDGVSIARGAVGNPWIFASAAALSSAPDSSVRHARGSP